MDLNMKSFILSMGIVLLSTSVLASEQRCLAEAIYFEARDQGWQGMLAVGVVIQNRVRDKRYPDTVCKVVRQGRYWKGNPVKNACQFSYYCDGKHERPGEKSAWADAKEIAALLRTTGVSVRGLEKATHYHAVWVRPVWSKALKRCQKIGQHIFYTEK
jgi:spore germination cell wall hydrolase CwlJ-like protein|tara:strand:- start:1886 stop:2359 length:474 start_codon:yes stop_codon:yes gene_type:complete